MQCHKSLYLQKYYPELKDPIPPSREALFQSGSEVGILAHELFPGGVEIPFEAGDYDRQVRLTQEAIAKGAKTIYEASFNYDGIFVKTDILHKGKNGWALYEVKSSTGFKDIYYPDISVQYYVLNGVGIPVTRAYLVHINNQYVRHGEIDPFTLFSILDVTGAVASGQSSIREEIAHITMSNGRRPLSGLPRGSGCANEREKILRLFLRIWASVPAPVTGR